jgi:hypothetical protein
LNAFVDSAPSCSASLELEPIHLGLSSSDLSAIHVIEQRFKDARAKLLALESVEAQLPVEQDELQKLQIHVIATAIEIAGLERQGLQTTIPVYFKQADSIKASTNHELSKVSYLLDAKFWQDAETGLRRYTDYMPVDKGVEVWSVFSSFQHR